MPKNCQAIRICNAERTRARTRALGTTLLIFILFGLGGCQNNIAANLSSGIQNFPSTVLPSQFESTAFIDNDFSIPNASVEKDGEHAVIRTYFATNRTSYEGAEAYSMFREGRDSKINFGKSYVTLRRSSDTLDIEPPSLTKVAIVDEPAESKVLSHNEILDREDFSKSLDSAINRADDSSVLVFIHGFNVSFEDAAIRSAQLSYDLGFPGTTVFYSWPSRGESPTYVADASNAQASQRHLELMLNDLMLQTSASRIYVIAHNLGARLASRALKSLYLAQPGFRSRVKELVLVAPDIDVDEFTQELIPYLGTRESPVTLYASANDPLLTVSKSLNDRPLAGDSSNNVLITRYVESIDAGTADTNFALHSAYTDPSSILGDIRGLINNGLRANSRSLLTAEYVPAGTYWKFR